MSLVVEKLHIEARLKGGVKAEIVHSSSFFVKKGTKLALVGRSGCGKTMTAMSILGLLPQNCAASGSVTWNGTELLSMPKADRRKLLGREFVLIPQSGADFLNPSLTVRRQMGEALARLGVPHSARRGRMEELLHGAGFDEPERILKSYPFQLSGGMAQRVVMAIASAGSPGLVIADEPTRGVDRDNTRLFLDNLDSMFGSAAVLLITHDISVAAQCDYILVMDNGRIIEWGDSNEILTNPKELGTHNLICDVSHALVHAERGLD